MGLSILLNFAKKQKQKPVLFSLIFSTDFLFTIFFLISPRYLFSVLCGLLCLHLIPQQHWSQYFPAWWSCSWIAFLSYIQPQVTLTLSQQSFSALISFVFSVLVIMRTSMAPLRYFLSFFLFFNLRYLQRKESLRLAQQIVLFIKNMHWHTLIILLYFTWAASTIQYEISWAYVMANTNVSEYGE